MLNKNLEKYVAKNKIYSCFKKKRNVLLNKKVIFVFHTIFTFTVLSTDVCIPFLYFCCSLISVSKKPNIETMLTLPYSKNWQKFNKINEKRS